MNALEFPAFFEAVHGHRPFPWQVRAAQRLVRREAFPITVPTGLGKSALIDAAVWAAARGGWRRIAFVVDRRIVVDAVHQRAERIKQVLESAQDSSMRELAKRLGDVQIVRLRGGVFGDDDWVLYPDRLSIVLSTVDQIGSRLLFRGYGVNARRWPLHAAFFASDTLIVVDEAHLSRPFLQTLDGLKEAGADISVVPMSATLPGAAQETAVGLEVDDLQLQTVRRRLEARKPARLLEAAGSEDEFVKSIVEQVNSLACGPGVAKTAVVVNRVATARRCFERLVRMGIRSVLLTGRTRPLDRDRRLREVLPEVEAGRRRQSGDAPLVVVATQTIEVGADFDFDALITECAPLSALRQRFGRLDRLGERGASPAVVLRRDKDDPVYAEATTATWQWLCERAGGAGQTIDFGLATMGETLAAYLAPAEKSLHAATLLPAHIAMLSQTGVFAPELDVSPWLHGPTDKVAEVTIVWREDLHADAPDEWPRAVALLPPLLREGLAMPVAAVRRWLTGGKPGDQWSDLEASEDDDKTGSDTERPVLRWRGPDDCRTMAASEIRPGDTLVLPASYGGCDGWGWAPDERSPVPDLADECLLEAGTSRRPAARLAEGHWSAFGAEATELQLRVAALQALEAQAPTAEDDLDSDIASARDMLLAAVRTNGSPLLAALRDIRIEPHPRGYVLRGEGTEEVEGQIETGRAVALDEHHADVGRWARKLAAGDQDDDAVVTAAEVHDAGKREPRMQVLLHGNPLAAQLGPPLAKSALRRRADQLEAWKSSGMPRGFRHEFASLEFEPQPDPLTRHLVATHHGYGRPWLPVCEDRGAQGARFAGLQAHWVAGWAEAIQARGPWRLAYLEWLLRAADARASMEEAEAGTAGGNDEQR